MRHLRTVAVGVLVVFLATGCALRERKWGGCAIAGGLFGAAVGGITGGVATNNAQEQPDQLRAWRGHRWRHRRRGPDRRRASGTPSATRKSRRHPRPRHLLPPRRRPPRRPSRS